jgi:hypothetical protein
MDSSFGGLSATGDVTAERERDFSANAKLAGTMLRNIGPASLPVKLVSDLRETATVYQIKNQQDYEK